MHTPLRHLTWCLCACSYVAGGTSGAIAAGQTNSATPATRPSSIELGAPLPSGHPYPQTSVIPAGVDSPAAPYPGEAKQKPDIDHAHKNGEWVIAPIPFSNQAIHFGVVPVVQYVFHVDPADKKSPPSFVAAAGTIATRGTWVLGGGTSLYFKQDFTEFSIGPKLLQDTRDDVFYPTAGHSFQFDADFFHAERTSAVFPDKTENYQNYQPSYNHYLSFTPKQMLAVRGMICTVQGSPPFFDLCQFGMQSDIRGYQPGRYRDRRMFAAQAEYRNATTRRIGFVVFFGIGEVVHNWNAFTAGDLLPAGGPGLRINMSKKQRINMRIDTGYGKDGLVLELLPWRSILGT